MEIVKHNAARGWIWIKHGYQLIMHNPMLGISTSLIAAALIFLTLLVPVAGPMLAVIVAPIMLAGYMRICRALEEGEEIELGHLFAGLKQHTSSLTSLGGFLMLGLIIASALMFIVGGDAFKTMMEQMQASDDPQVFIDAIGNAGGQVAVAALIGFSFVMVLVVAWQYAPILVFFSGITPLAAMRASFVGTMRNIVPYTVYSLLMQLIALVLGVLPFNLGIIILLPLGLASLYVSYRNIFPWLDAPAAAPVTETGDSNAN